MVNNEFSKYHPVTNLIYFTLCFVSVFYISNPFVIFILLIVSSIYNITLDKGKNLRSNLFFYIFIGIIIFLFNPLFSHRGEVILFYLFDNPITLESVVFGLKSALSLVTLLVMFSAFNLVIHPEKFIYLFSRIAEQTAFVVMLGLRFVPTFRRRMTEISDIAKVSRLNNPSKKQSFFKNIKRKINEAMNTIMTLITWSLEDAVITAQSMRSRGYGANIKSQNGRTFYFIYKFTKRDILFILFNVSSFVLFLFTLIRYDLDFKIYPTFSSSNLISDSISMFFISSICLTIQFALPILVEIINRVKWSFIYNADNRI